MIVTSIPAFGQNHFMGFKGGINWTNVYSSNFGDDHGNRIGFNCGLTYEYQLNKRFNLGIDFLYFQKGFTGDILFTDDLGNPTGEKASIEFNYDYLSLPIKGGFVMGDKFSGFVNLGVVPSILIDAKIIKPAIEGSREEPIDATEMATKFDLAGIVEIGANYKILPDFLLSTAIGYQQSFTSITNDDYFSKAEVRHYGIIMSIGLKYALKEGKRP